MIREAFSSHFSLGEITSCIFLKATKSINVSSERRRTNTVFLTLRPLVMTVVEELKEVKVEEV